MNKLIRGKAFEDDNLLDLIRTYDFKGIRNLMVKVDELETGADLVVYDVGGMLEVPSSVEEFSSIVNENGLDEAEFEIDRWTLVRTDL